MTTVSEPCVHLFAAFDQGIQVSYSKETETVTLAFPEELKVTLKFLQYHTRGNFLSLFELNVLFHYVNSVTMKLYVHWLNVC